MPNSTPYPIEEVILKAFRFGASGSLMRNCPERELEIISKMLGERLRFDLETYIYGKEHEEKKISYPVDWWEALKDRFAPKWFLKKYPVRSTVITCSLKEIYPDIEPVLPQKNPVIKFLVTENYGTR